MKERTFKLPIRITRSHPRIPEGAYTLVPESYRGEHPSMMAHAVVTSIERRLGGFCWSYHHAWHNDRVNAYQATFVRSGVRGGMHPIELETEILIPRSANEENSQ